MGEETSEPLERELKFPCPDLPALRERLLELEAERTANPSHEDNWVFDLKKSLEKKGCLLRLRSDPRGARLTWKGPARFEGAVKIREERETEIGDAEELFGILDGLGFKVARRYQKIREEWRLGGVVIALDRTPIGDYVEFEGEGAEKVAVRTGFDLEEAERRTYLAIYDDYLRENPDAPPDMVFP